MSQISGTATVNTNLKIEPRYSKISHKEERGT